MKRAKCIERKDAHDPEHTSSSVTHGGGVMAWACMAASLIGWLIFMDDVTHGGCSRMTSEVYRYIQSISEELDQAKDMHSKHTSKTIKGLHRGLKQKVVRLVNSITRSYPNWAAFHLLKRRLKGKSNWKKLQETSGKASQNKNATTSCKQQI